MVAISLAVAALFVASAVAGVLQHESPYWAQFAIALAALCLACWRNGTVFRPTTEIHNANHLDRGPYLLR